MKKTFLLKTMLLLCALVVGGSAWATDITYTFSSKAWAASDGSISANWTSGKNGNGFTSGQGVQVTTGTTGANATSPASFSNISKIVVTYNTNKNQGAGSIEIKIGDNAKTTNNVAWQSGDDGTSANYTTEFNYTTTQSGYVKLTVNTTTNSIWVKSIKITYTPDDGKTDPTLSFPQESYNVNLGEEFTSPTLSRDADGTGAVTYESSKTSVATVDSSTGAITVNALGSTTITAYVAADDKYRAGSAQYVLNVLFAITDGVFDFEHAGAASPLIDYGSGVTLSSDPYTTTAKTWTAGNVTMVTSGKYRWWSADKSLRFYETSHMEFSVPDGYVITRIDHSAGTLSNPTNGSMSGGSWIGASKSVKLQASGNFKSVAVTYAPSVSATISTAEYATFCDATNALDFSNTGIKVFTAKDNVTSVTLSEVTTGKVPANTPVVLYKAGGATINVPVIASADAITATNDLRVSDGTTTLSNAYVLAKPEGEAVGFYPWGGSTLSAGKIYLQGSAPTRDFIGIGDASSISNVKVNTNLDGNYYDLQGRQVAQPTKGLYIVNGKKVFVK